uniref:MATH domain-containing protein n=1 Tax=Cacopsylla melanoneura TaxID=428564 RepID=A0A8D8X0R0_9HEMI
MFEFMPIAHNKPFNKYKENIQKKQLDKFNDEPRKSSKDLKDSSDYLRFLFTVTDIKKLKDISEKTIPYSQEKYSVNHLKWDFYAEYYNDPDTSVEYMGLYLHCDSERKDWEVCSSYQLALLTNDPFSKKRDICMKSSCDRMFESIGSHESEWGWRLFVTLSTLFDPNNDYIKDDSIRVEVCLKINSTD